MGKQANEKKERNCLVCGGTFNTTSGGLKKHAKQCAIDERAALSHDNHA